MNDIEQEILTNSFTTLFIFIFSYGHAIHSSMYKFIHNLLCGLPNHKLDILLSNIRLQNILHRLLICVYHLVDTYFSSMS